MHQLVIYSWSLVSKASQLVSRSVERQQFTAPLTPSLFLPFESHRPVFSEVLSFELPLPLQSGVGRRLPHAFWLPLAAFYHLCHKRERYEGSADRRNGSMNGPRFPLPKMAILRAVLSSEGTEWLWKLQPFQWRGTRTEGYKPAALTLGSGLDLQFSCQCHISSRPKPE